MPPSNTMTVSTNPTNTDNDPWAWFVARYYTGPGAGGSLPWENNDSQSGFIIAGLFSQGSDPPAVEALDLAPPSPPRVTGKKRSATSQTSPR